MDIIGEPKELCHLLVGAIGAPSSLDDYNIASLELGLLYFSDLTHGCISYLVSV